MSASKFLSPLAEDKADQVAEQLQPILFDSIDLALILKQAHWNVRGALFVPLHEQLDKIEATVQESVDDLAERLVTIGHPANGLSKNVASASRLNPIRTQFLPTQEVIHEISGRLHTLIGFFRGAIEAVGEIDPVTEDLLIGITSELEKHLWMLQSQQL